jgi:hypothetical protein
MLLRRHHALTQDERVAEPEEVANSHVDLTEDEIAAQAVKDAAEAASAAEAAKLADEAEAKRLAAAEADAKEAEREAAKHGDLYRPARQHSTDAWVDYAKADPKYDGPSLEARTGLRDEIATHYLGTPE